MSGPLAVLLGGALLAAGAILASRTALMRERPDLAFALLVAYGIGVLGVVRVCLSILVPR